MSDTRTIVTDRILSAAHAVGALLELQDDLVTIADVIRSSVEAGGTIYTCGNGGSAAEALHLAEELVGRYEQDRPPIAAACLNADPTALTCIGNDYGFERIFARQCEALIGPGDVLVAFSTSGSSPNILRALEAAVAKGGTTVGLLGRDGGEAADVCNHVLIAPGNDSATIQECHQVALHAVCSCLEP